MESSSRSLWRQKAADYFGVEESLFYQYTTINTIHQPVKIALDMNFPLSFYVGGDGRCSLFSLSGGMEETFRTLSVCTLPSSSKAQASLIGNPTSIAHYNNWLLIATVDGITHYEINSNDVVRGQNIDDFVQMGLQKQAQPSNTTYVASFYSSDIQIPSWPNVHSVIETNKLRRDDLIELKKTVDAFMAKNRIEFQATFVGFFDHNVPNKEPAMPLSGPPFTGVRQISFNYKSPNSFQSICGCQWFDWDLARQKLKNVGAGDGFQLLSIDTSTILRETFAVGTHGGNVLLHDSRCKDSIQQKSFNDPRPISNVKFSPVVQPLIATSSDDFKIKLWDLRVSFDKPFLTLEGHTNEITGIQFSAHRADFLYSSSYDGTVRVWNINNQLPPHHCVTVTSPSNGSPVLELAAGYHRPDSFYFSCANGTTGICRFKEKMYNKVIPHKLKSPDDRTAEKLQYFRKYQQLLEAILPRVQTVLSEKSDVKPIFPLLDLVNSKPFDIEKNKLSTSPLNEIIEFYSYYPSTGIPPQFMQATEHTQLSNAFRFQIFGNVIGSIQNNDAETLMVEKRNIMAIIEAFSREDILSITKVLASASFEEALEVGATYLSLLISNKKLDKFLDIGYFLLFPTIFDDPTKEFQVLAKVEHNVRTQLRVMLNNGPKVLEEINAYHTTLATATNDREESIQFIFNSLKKLDRFLSMFLCRSFLSIALSLGQWSHCIIMASQIAKDTIGFPMHDIIYEWLENAVREKFSVAIVETLQSKSTDPASYINAISEVILIGLHAQELPKSFEETMDQLIILIRDILQNLLKDEGSIKVSKASPVALALAIKQSVDSFGRAAAHQGGRSKTVMSLMTLITNVISAAPSSS